MTEPRPIDPEDGLALLRADAAAAAARGRWGRALMAAGWVHLAAFLACHAIRDPAVKSNPWHAALWLLDASGCVLAVRLAAGRGWWRASPAARLVARLWGTYFILTFNLAMLNALSGWDHDWFKPAWCGLGSFGMAAMAWLFDARFLIPAVQMWATGLLMVLLPDWNYPIFGASWWAALQGIGLALERARGGAGIGAHRMLPGAKSP